MNEFQIAEKNYIKLQKNCSYSWFLFMNLDGIWVYILSKEREFIPRIWNFWLAIVNSGKNIYHKVASCNTPWLLQIAYLLWPFGKKFFFWISNKRWNSRLYSIEEKETRPEFPIFSHQSPRGGLDELENESNKNLIIQF